MSVSARPPNEQTCADPPAAAGESGPESFGWLLDNLSEAFWRFDVDEPIPVSLAEQERAALCFRRARLGACSRGMAAAHGYGEPAEMAGLGLERIVPPSDPRNAAFLREFVRSGHRLIDAPMVERDRQGRARQTLGSMIGQIENGRIARLWGVSRDMTGWRGAEREGLLLSRVLECMTEGVSVTDEQGVIVYTNPAEDALFGYEHGELIGMHVTVRNGLPPEESERAFRAVLAELEAKGSWAGEWPNVRKDGTPFTTFARVTALDAAGRRLYVCVREDITERKLAAERMAEVMEELRRRVEELEALLNVLPVGIFIAGDPACERISMNPAGAAMLRLERGMNASKSAAGGESLPFRVLREGREVPAEDLPMQRAARTGRAVVAEEYTVVHADGGATHLYEYATPLFDSAGRVRGCLGVFVDITARRNAEEALRESEARFRAMADSAPVLVWLAGTDKHRSWFNRPWLAFTGRGMSQEVGGGWTEGVHPDDAERCVRAYEASFDARREFRTEYRLRRRDGVHRWVLDHGIPMFLPDGTFNGYIGSCIDITEMVEAREVLERHSGQLAEVVAQRTAELEQSNDRLRLSERMAALGTLSAGIGHDMANLLLPVRARLDAMRARGFPEEFAPDLGAIEHAAKYLQSLAGGLRLLSADPDNGGSHGPTDLQGWWAEVGGLMRAALPRHIELSVRLEAAGAPLVAKAALTQAVYNLVQNASDILSEHAAGRVEIWAADAGEGRTEIGVTDDGPGMTEEVRRRCLEPFFTSKTRKLSTGLGLALVHGIVQRAGGALSIRTEIGRGTTVVMSLPAEGSHGHGKAGCPTAAAVSIRDARQRGFVVALLRSRGAAVAAEPAAPDGAAVWIVSRNAVSADDVREFLMKEPQRRVVVLGGDGALVDHDRAVHVPGPFEASRVGAAIQRALANGPA